MVATCAVHGGMMMKAMNSLVMCLGVALVGACGVSADDGYVGEDGTGDSSAGADAGNRTPVDYADAGAPEVCAKMDILFVIDDSGSMGEEQNNLIQNFPQIINVLDSYMSGAGDLDYRVAVTTTGRDVDYVVDVTGGLPIPIPGLEPIPMSEEGDNGVMRQECGMTKRWIDRDDGNVADTFACVANVGTSGPGMEMPLYTTQLALDDRMADGTNAGFLREDSLLGIVILTDEDDCSRTDNDFTVDGDQCQPGDPAYLPVSDTISFLDELTGARGRWATAVIAGETACTSEFGEAGEASNLKNFVNQTGDNAVFSSICSGDLATPLAEAIATFDAACKTFDPID